jgi:glycosyltransferase involved in cell wall biosynthesis
MVADLPLPGEPIDGGVQAVTSYLVEALSKSPEVELHVISFRPGLDGIRTLRADGIARYLIPYGRLGTLTVYAADQRNLEKCLRDIAPQLVHSQGGGHEGIVAKRAGYPTVVTIHGILGEEVAYVSGRAARMRTRIQSWLSDFYCIRRATNTIMISPYVAEHYRGALAGRTYLVPNPVHEQFFRLVRREVPGKVLFAGRLCARKGVRELLQAAGRIRTHDALQLVLAGSLADREYVDQLRSDARRLGIEDKVEFRGSLTADELLSQLSECSCLVLPSFQETAPMVIQEAMAAGVPVVASNICGIPFQIDDGRTGFLVPAGDVVTLSARIGQLLEDAALRQRLGQAARLKAEERYRADAVARMTIGVYREMLNSGSA